jgi:hypothetical protein
MPSETKPTQPSSPLAQLLEKLIFPDEAVNDWLQHLQKEVFDPSFAPDSIHQAIRKTAALGLDKEIALLMASEMVQYWNVDWTVEKTHFWVDHEYAEHAKREEEARKRSHRK